jgi:hypothetical protein
MRSIYLMVDAICTPYDINYFGANGLDFYGIRFILT